MKLSRTKIISMCIIFVFAMGAAIYFYGLHLSFWPDPEFCLLPIRYYFEEKFNYEFVRSGFGFSEGIAQLSYQLFGVGYRGIRFYAAIMYFFIILCVVILSGYSFSAGKVKWHVLPLVAFMAVLLNPGSSAACGHHTLAYHVYPYDMHTEAAFMVVFILILLKCATQIKADKKRYALFGIIVLLSMVGILKTDLLFLLGYILPIICVGLSILFKKNRNAIKPLLIIGLGAIVVIRGLSLFVDPLKRLFSVEEALYGSWTEGKNIYGNTGFVSLYDIWSNISCTVTELLALFNVEITGSILSVHTVINAIKIVLIVLMFVLAAKQIIDSFRISEEKQDYVSIISSYSIWLNLIFVLISRYGSDQGCIRYMTLITFMGTILLCRQIDKVCNFVFKKDDNRIFIFIVFTLCCLIDLRPFWREDSLHMDYETSLEEVADIIEENELGNGVGGHWYSTTLTALMEGEYAVIEGFIYDNRLIKYCEAPVNYIVDGNGSALAAQSYFKTFELDDVYKIYGEPDRVWQTDAFTIWYYEEGLN